MNFIGSGGWIRTSDQLINSQLRYRCATPERIARIIANRTNYRKGVFSKKIKKAKSENGGARRDCGLSNHSTV